MKKLLLIVLSVSLLWGMMISADGENGLPDIGDSLPIIVAELPDPGESLGIAGIVYQNDYSYNGILYDLYRFMRPNPADAFIDAYTSACEDAGWSVSKGKEAGNDALYLSDGEFTAILLYDYQGYMLLMIPGEAEFTLHTDIQPIPEPVEIKSNMLCFDYKGRHYEGTVSSCLLQEFFSPYASDSDSRHFFVTFGGFDEFSVFGTIDMGIPISMQAGDSYTVTPDDNPVPVPGFNFGEKPGYYILNSGMISSSLSPYCGRNDYFTITIRTAEHTETGYLVEGTFECDLASEDSRRRQKFENGTFSFCVKDQ